MSGGQSWQADNGIMAHRAEGFQRHVAARYCPFVILLQHERSDEADHGGIVWEDEPVMDADGPAPKVLFADKGYDADFMREDMEKRGGTAMIPTKRNRLVQLPVDAAIYALRNKVEHCFNKLKNARRPATRYDKTADSYLGFIHIVSIRMWMLSCTPILDHPAGGDPAFRRHGGPSAIDADSSDIGGLLPIALCGRTSL